MKAQIFVGDARTGKTRVAQMISEYVGREKTFWIQANEIRGKYGLKLSFSGIPATTELVIFDDCPKSFDYTKFFCVEDKRPYGGDLEFRFLVEERGKKKREILIPQIIFTTNELDEKWKAYWSFNARFEIIQFPLPELVYATNQIVSAKLG